ncbi:MAG: class I SAM-dependent methyltransferase [Acidobacteriaceae bacterium]
MSAPNFNHIARAYRWMEYASFGRALERCRFHFLPLLFSDSHALVLGDGDGRFLSRLLAQNSALQADAVDASSTMLSLLHQRSIAASPSADHRLTLHQADIRSFTPPRNDYDLVITHFFFDCLSDAEATHLVQRIRMHTEPGALWLISEFSVPQYGLMRLPAHFLVSSLYFAFHQLTDLRPTRLPDYSAALTAVGFVRLAHHRFLGGLLVSELWQRA